MASTPLTYRALGYEFTVTVEGHDALSDFVPRLLASFADRSVGSGESSDGPVPWTIRDTDGGDIWELLAGDARQATATTPSGLVGPLVHGLNTAIIPEWGDVVCHAGGVAADGKGVVLPADPEAGKSTLTTGLVRAGFAYLSDEAIAFRRGECVMEPYPKPVSLDPGSWSLFADLEPREELGNDDYKQDQWQVPPDAIRPGCVSGPTRARVIVFPQYVAGASTELVPVRRVEALVDVARNTFYFNQKSRVALEQLAEIVRAVDCYRLTVGSLDDAVDEIETLVASLPEVGNDG